MAYNLKSKFECDHSLVETEAIVMMKISRHLQNLGVEDHVVASTEAEIGADICLSGYDTDFALLPQTIYKAENAFT